MRQITIDHFWDRVNKNGPIPAHNPKLGRCWLWSGRLGCKGYGLVSIEGLRTLTHRASWIITNGTIPKGMLVLHECDVPNCVNPKHLKLGTHADNVHDMVSRNRTCREFPTIRKDNHWTRRMPNRVLKGESNGNSTTPEAKVRKAFELKESGMSTKIIASTLHVSINVLHNIFSGKTWKHLGITLSEKAKKKYHWPSQCKLTEEQARQVFVLRKQGWKQREIANHFHITISAVCLILKGVNWPHLKLSS